MKTCLVLVTHNRLQYTKKCLGRLLDDMESDFELHVWDNASTDDTPRYLSSLAHPRLKSVVLSNSNLGQTAAMNRIWSNTKLELVAKLDNDCLTLPGWLRKMGQAHRDVREFGALACWHYRLEDFDDRVARRKIRQFGGHKIVQHPWVCGSGFVMKRETYMSIGPWPEGSPDISTTGYFVEMARKGYVNGWYYPLILQHHMDDPLSPYCCYSDDASLRRVYDTTFTLRVHKLDSMRKRLQRRERVIKTLLYGSSRAEHYVGWHQRIRRLAPRFDQWRWSVANAVDAMRAVYGGYR